MSVNNKIVLIVHHCRQSVKEIFVDAGKVALRFHCTPAQHFSGRDMHNRNGTLWCSWVVIGNQQRLYFSGDSSYFPGFKELGENIS